MSQSWDDVPGKLPEEKMYHGHSGVQRCGDWCRHFVSLDEMRWEGFGRCVHPLSLRNGEVFSVRRECRVGESSPPGPQAE